MITFTEEQRNEKMRLRKEMYAEGKLMTLRELLFRVKKYFPENPAVLERVKKEIVIHTVDGFYKDVRALATYFLANGFVNSHIGIVGANSYNWIVVFFAVTTSGNTLITLDKELPADDVLKLLLKSDAEAVFAGKNQIDGILTPENTRLFALTEYGNGNPTVDELIEEGNRLISQGESCYDGISIEGDDNACIIFTSGTTGANKGVMLSHRNLCYQTEEFIKVLSPVHKSMSVLPMNHIFELGCTVLPSIYSNSPLFINDKLARFLDNIKEWQPEYMSIVPLFMDKFYNTVVDKTKANGTYEDVLKRIDESHALMEKGIDRREEIFADIREDFGLHFPKFACGGAPANPEKSRFLSEIGFRIFIGYGLTETSPVASVHRNSWENTASVGTPFSETEVMIDEPNAEGIGEIRIKGTNVAKGYYNDPEADRLSFENGWFKSGDYGRIDEKGELYITGRKKNLIILDNGKNIYPEEIETFFINGAEEVKEAVVFEAASIADSGKRVLVMSVSMPEELYCEDSVRALTEKLSGLNSKLPAYKKIQEFFVVNHEFVRTSSKKIIRKKIEEEYKEYTERMH